MADLKEKDIKDWESKGRNTKELQNFQYENCFIVKTVRVNSWVTNVQLSLIHIQMCIRDSQKEWVKDY